MQPIKLNNKEALIVDVPEWSHTFTIGVDGDCGFDYLNCMGDRIWNEQNIELPEGNWTILGSLNNGIPDFDVREYVEKLVLQGIKLKGKQIIIVKNV